VSYTRTDGTRMAARLEPRPPRVAGRDELLAEMDRRLGEGDGGGPVVVALTGIGGIGKTTAALEFAHRHVGRYDVVWHFHAEDATALLAQFGEPWAPASGTRSWRRSGRGSPGRRTRTR
jgi:hypothetical protein